jgi:hypothetical protein
MKEVLTEMYKKLLRPVGMTHSLTVSVMEYTAAGSRKMFEANRHKLHLSSDEEHKN